MAALKSVRTWSIALFGIALLLVAATAYAIAGSRNGLVGYRDAFSYLRWIAQAGGIALIISLVVLGVSLKSKQAGSRLYAGLASVIMAAIVGTLVANQATTGSRVDLRSHSREGVSDLGKNAARIMEFRVAFLET